MSPSTPRTTAKQRAIAAEADHLDRVHDRVEQLRRRADERASAAGADRSGSTFQARFERDVTAHHHASRAARYTFGDVESLAFGRLDLDDGDTLHIGRVSVVDEDGDVLLVDWRAPASAAFYRATAAEPLGVARRRTLVTRGREVRDLDDEVLDVDAADRLGLQAVTGQGALLAALSRTRTGTMRDIVATIQADQDRIIRAPASGTLLLSGGPGTGKTVVALHRVAYLLYGDRERFEGRGVLVVGPSRAFTEYTARVLPALGEDRVVQRPLAAFAPATMTVDGWDDLEVAQIKGRIELVELAQRLLHATRPPLPPTTRVSFEGTTATVADRDVARIRDRLLDRVAPTDGSERTYHSRTATANAALLALLWRRWRDQHRAGGGSAPDEHETTGFAEAMAEAAGVTMLRRCFWPPTSAEEVVGALADGEVDLVPLADGLLTAREVGLLRAAWDAATSWTIDDVALLDEVDALLGPRTASGRGAATSTDRGQPWTDEEPDDDPWADDPDDDDDEVVGGRAPIALVSDRLRDDVDVVEIADESYRDFAHVVVDEAQDLTPLQWRMVARRGPYASWTVVGDLAQRSRDDDAGWDEIAAMIGRREVTRWELDVNYRTPSEVAAVAGEVLAAAGRDPSDAPRAVRDVGFRPRLLRTDDTVAGAAASVAEAIAGGDGTIAVIASGGDLEVLRAAVDEVAGDAAHRVVVLDARTAKGLEFDDVVVVAPDRLAGGAAVGMRQLYVAVTRATRSLTMIAAPDADVPGAQHCEVVTAT